MLITVSHILVRHRYEAEDILRKLKEGVLFTELAQKFSICSSNKNSGFLGEVEITRLDPDFAQAALELKPNVVSGIVKTRFGYHLIQRH